MKTVKRNEEIKRVSDLIARDLVEHKGWSYCPKIEWKKIRKATPAPAPIPEPKAEEPIEAPKAKKASKKKEK